MVQSHYFMKCQSKPQLSLFYTHYNGCKGLLSTSISVGVRDYSPHVLASILIKWCPCWKKVQYFLVMLNTESLYNLLFLLWSMWSQKCKLCINVQKNIVYNIAKSGKDANEQCMLYGLSGTAHMAYYMIIRKNKLLTKAISWMTVKYWVDKVIRKDQISYGRYLYGRYKVRK